MYLIKNAFTFLYSYFCMHLSKSFIHIYYKKQHLYVCSHVSGGVEHLLLYCWNKDYEEIVCSIFGLRYMYIFLNLVYLKELNLFSYWKYLLSKILKFSFANLTNKKQLHELLIVDWIVSSINKISKRYFT